MISRIAPLTLAIAACDVYEPGIEVEIKTSAAIGEGPLHGLVTFRDGDGGIEVSHLHLAVASIELVECPQSMVSALFEGLLIGTAHAHSMTTPLVLGIPHVIDAARISTVERTIGTLRPPPGRYCGINLAFGPADADAVGLDPSTGSSAVGRTMILQGLDWLEGQPRPLVLETDQRIEVRVDFVGDDGEPQELELSAARKQAVVSYRLLPSHWIAGLADAPDDQARAQIMLQNLVSSAQATIK